MQQRVEGFFKSTKKETKKPKKEYDCTRCGLRQNKSDKIATVIGNGAKQILILGEFNDFQYEYLGRALDQCGVDIYEDCWTFPSIQCPSTSDKHTNLQLRCCKNNWEKVIEELNPHAIWLMGESPFSSFYIDKVSDDKNDSRITATLLSWRRWCIPDRKTGAWILPMLHPDIALNGNDYDGINAAVFLKDVRWAVMNSKQPAFVFRNFLKDVTLFTNDQFEDLLAVLCSIKNGDTITFDYETTGLKPYRKGHRILTCSIKILSSKIAFSFPLQWKGHWTPQQQQRLLDVWKYILGNEAIHKIAHNMKFEHIWSKIILGVETKGWLWDTMVTQHLLDARAKLTGLKTQAFLRFGVDEYDDKVRKFMEADLANDFNTLEQVPLEDVLLYNGMDAILEEALYLEQLKQKDSVKDIRELYHDGSLALADMELEGVHANKEYYTDARVLLQKHSLAIRKQLESSDEAVTFKELTGRDLSITSTKDLPILFYDILEEEAVKKTTKGKPSVDVESLSSFVSPFAQKLMTMRKLDKLEGTFLKNFEQEAYDGMIHPFFHLHLARSSRGSSSDPNFQNVPKRDKEAMELVRGGIFPKRGFEIIGADYKQMEIVCQACVSGDDVMAQYVVDQDMHLDTAMDIFMLPEKLVSKPLRQLAKNGFNFPEIYGDYAKAISKALWKEIAKPHSKLADKDGTLITAHLRSKGVKCYTDFERHIKTVELNFWSKFYATKEWRDKKVEEYKSKLVVTTLTGFRRAGFLRRNEICNTPVQSVAFHCLLWSIIQINRIRKEEGWKSSIIGQIHDQILLQVHPSEKKHVVQVVEDYMTVKIKDHFKWLVTPLKVDFEYSGVNGAWSCSEEL